MGREFHLEDIMILWDGLFADSKELELLDYICVAMLMYLRNQREPLLSLSFVGLNHSSQYHNRSFSPRLQHVPEETDEVSPC